MFVNILHLDNFVPLENLARNSLVGRESLVRFPSRSPSAVSTVKHPKPNRQTHRDREKKVRNEKYGSLRRGREGQILLDRT